MAYIGNTQQNQNYVPAIDYFSGNGSTTAFTLSRPVASVAQVQAVIENVPQNPGDAYTVSGNTITFTSAPPSGTNNIYIYYTSPNTQVTALPQSPVVYGNLNFGSTGARIQGDFSNATIANRVAFQTSTTNGSTTILVLPNGTGPNAQLLLRGSSAAQDDSFGQVVLAGGSDFRIGSGASGTGTYLPMTFYTGGTERMRITSNGGIAFGGASNFGSSGQVLQSNGDAAPTWTTISTSAFPAGTRMSFQQTSAPTGWTKDTTAAINDSILRLVTGSVSSGGSTAFSTFNGQTATGATTLSTAQMPSHTHTVGGTTNASSNIGSGFMASSGTSVSSGATGGGGSHTHSITTSIKYYDFIIASKD